MAEAKENLLPYILDAITALSEIEERLGNIIKYVEMKLNEDGREIRNLMSHLKFLIQMDTNLGLISVKDNYYRTKMKFNSQRFQAMSRKENSRRHPRENQSATGPHFELGLIQLSSADPNRLSALNDPEPSTSRGIRRSRSECTCTICKKTRLSRSRRKATK